MLIWLLLWIYYYVIYHSVSQPVGCDPEVSHQDVFIGSLALWKIFPLFFLINREFILQQVILIINYEIVSAAASRQEG